VRGTGEGSPRLQAAGQEMSRVMKAFLHRYSFALIVAACLFTLAHSTYKNHHNDQLGTCKSNLRALGLAMEMYSTDNSARYPDNFADLVPEYIDQIPQCPASTEASYILHLGPDAPWNDAGFSDYYYICCAGQNHLQAGVPKNLPATNSISDHHAPYHPQEDRS